MNQLTYRDQQAWRKHLIAAIDAGDAARAAALASDAPAEDAQTGEDQFLLGRAAELAGETERAEQLYRTALAAEDMPTWCIGATAGALAGLLTRTARADEAAPLFEQSLACKDIESGWLQEYSNYLFYAHDTGAAATKGASMLDLAKAYGARLADVKPYRHKVRRRHEKIRIGYVSADFCRHVVAFFGYALLRAYDHGAYEVYCYMNGVEDGVSDEFRGWVDGWRNVARKSYAAIAKQIASDEIDILFDLGGHTGGNLLPVFAYRPAPIQLTGIGYFDTTGLAAMDYFLADETTLPAGVDAPFTEQILRMKHSHLCYMWHDDPPAPGPLPAGQRGCVTFGSLNNFAKVNDRVLALWAQVLAAVPQSRLLLKGKIFDDAYGCRLAFEKLARAGIDTARVDVEGASPDYLHAYQRIDIALDTFPYPGGGTTCDALYMGVPVVTLAGTTHHERFGKSILKNLGLGELVAETGADYVRIAAALAQDIPRLKALRQTLRRRMRQSPVMDMTGYVQEIEQLYQRIYWAWLSQGMTAKEQQRQVDKTAQKLARAYERHDWLHAILYGSRLLWRPAYVKDYAGLAGRAYLNIPVPDWARVASCFSQADRTPPVRQIEYVWLAGLAENRRRHHRKAIGLYQASLAACERYRAAGDEGARAFWDNPAFLAELYTEMALMELILGDVQAAAEHYRRAAEHGQTFSDRCSMYGSYLMTLHHLDIAPREMLAAHEGYSRLFEAEGIQPYTHAHHAHHDRIRVGYISGDFRRHVMFYFYYQLLAGHDAERFALYTYSLGETQDGFTELVKKAADVHRNVHGWEMKDIAAQIYRDEIDILVDLGGHTTGSGLAALGWRPAPVQVSGLGYMDTTGLPTVDYLITDRVCDPEDAPHYLTEQPLYLTSMFCYTGRTDVPAPQGAPCRRKGYVTFGVFNRYQKITDAMLALWSRILAAVPGSRLYCKAEAYYDDALVDEAYARFQRFGIDMERVTFELSSDDYMACYLDVDIALDTYPYVGGGTTCDALYMGVPVVARYGAGRGTRYAASILQAAGLGELATATDDDYVARAVGLASDTELLDVLHHNLRTMMFASPLMDTRLCVQEMEAAYASIWAAWEAEHQEG